MTTLREGKLFPEALLKEIRSRFDYLEKDHHGRERLFFENSGGSFRLKSAVEAKAYYERIPDCPERTNATSMELVEVKRKGISDILQVIFGATSGALVSELTASQVMFQITRVILENVPGKNVVTTSLEHPSAYDSLAMYAERTGKEFRVAMANPETGGVDVDEIVNLIDEDTCLLSVMSASNISGRIFPIKEIVTKARTIKPDLYIISDAVQHIPHAPVDVDDLGIDAMNFAPYKGMGIRGCGFGYVSGRLAKLPHHKLTAKDENEWELGTFPHPNFAAISAVVDYVCWIGAQFTESADRRELYLTGIGQIHLHERALLHHMLEGTDTIPGLRYIDSVHVYCDAEDLENRDLICAIGIDHVDMKTAVADYYERGVTVFERVNTSLYSKRIVESLNLTGAIRVSPFHCHTTEEIDAFLQCTSAMAAEYKERNKYE